MALPKIAQAGSIAVASASPGALPDASVTQDYLDAAIAAAAPPSADHGAQVAGGRFLDPLDHQQMAEPHAGEVGQHPARAEITHGQDLIEVPRLPPTLSYSRTRSGDRRQG
jgi:hypothetical protein